MAILLIAILSISTHTVIGSASALSSSLRKSGESNFQQKHDQASLTVLRPSPLLLQLQQYRRIKINNPEFSKVSDEEMYDDIDNSFRKLFYSRTRQKRDSGSIGAKMKDGKDDKGKGGDEDDYDYPEGKGDKPLSISSQTTFDDSITWPREYPGCDPQHNPHTSPVDISTADIVQVKNLQTLLVFSDEPKPDTYVLSTMHDSEGVRLEGFSIRLKNDDVVRDATYIAGLGTPDHRFFDSAIFFIRPQATQNSTSSLPPSRRAHTIDRKNFPMEIMFTFQTNLGRDITQIHVMVEIVEEENPIWHPILTMFKPLIENVIHERCFGAETAQQQKEELDLTSMTFKQVLSKQKKEMGSSTYREHYNELEELFEFLKVANEETLADINTKLELSRNTTESCEKMLEESNSNLTELRKNVNSLQKSLDSVDSAVNGLKLNMRADKSFKNADNNDLESTKQSKNVIEPADQEFDDRTKREIADNDTNDGTDDNGSQLNSNNAQSEDGPAKGDTSNQAVETSAGDPTNSDNSNQAVETSGGDPTNSDNSNQAVETSAGDPTNSDNSNQAVETSGGDPTNSDNSNQAVETSGGDLANSDNSNQTVATPNDDITVSSNSSLEASTKPANNATSKSDSDSKLEALSQEKEKLENELQEGNDQLKMLTKQHNSYKKCIQDMTYFTVTAENELQRLTMLRKYYRVGSGPNDLFPSVAAVQVEMERSKSDSERLETLRQAYEAGRFQYDSLMSTQRRSITLLDPFHISWLFPARGGHYFYNGSSPIPPCSERPFVIVFEDRITISQKQLELFHRFPATEQKDEDAWNKLCTDEFETTDEKLLYVEGMEPMKNQVPKITPLRHRTVWYNPRNLQYKGDDGVHMLSRKRLLKKGRPSKLKKR